LGVFVCIKDGGDFDVVNFVDEAVGAQQESVTFDER